MKNNLVFFYLFIGINLNAQVWIDSLRVAQELYKSQDYDEALRLYKKAKVGSDEEILLQEELAQTAYRLGDYESSQSAFQSAIEKETNKDKQAILYYNQGNVCFKMRDYTGAIRNYKLAIIKNPKNSAAKYNLSQALRKQRENQSNETKPSTKASNGDDDNKKENNNQKGKEFSIEKQAAESALDELLRNAQQTKRRVTKKATNSTKSKKDW